MKIIKSLEYLGKTSTKAKKYIFELKIYLCRKDIKFNNVFKKTNWLHNVFRFTPIQDGPLWSCSRMVEQKDSPLSKICHTYATIITHGIVVPYPKNILEIYKSRDITPLELCWHQHFSPEFSHVCYIKKYRYILHFNT